MRKKKGSLFIFNSAIFQIVLLISFSFAVSFIMSDYVDVVSGVSHEAGVAVASDAATGAPVDSYGQYVPPTGTTTTTTPVATGGGFGRFFGGLTQGTSFGTGSGALAGALLTEAVWGGIVYGVVSLVGNLIGLDEGVDCRFACL